MSDYRDVLERLGERAGFPEDSFDRLTRRRTRKRRTTRITAGAVALLVAAAGSLSVFAIANRPEDRLGGLEDAGFYALWPETDLSIAQEAQDRVDAGQDAWRLDPEATAVVLARRLLRWPHQTVTCWDPCGVDPTDPDRARIHVSPEPVGHEGLTLPPMTVHLRRLLRPGQGGIWSVVKIDGRFLELPFEPGQDVEVPQTIFVSTLGAGADSFEFEMGWTDGTCGGTHGEPLGPVDGVGLGSIRLAPEDTTCEASGDGVRGSEGASTSDGPLSEPTRGWVSVNRVPEGESTVPVFGQPRGFLETFPREIVIHDIAAVAVRFVPRTDSEVTTCEPAPFGPTYLPWVAEGEKIPPPIEQANDDGSWVAIWKEDPSAVYGPMVSLARSSSPPSFEGDGEGVEVRGHPAGFTWIGDPGVGALALSWLESNEPCSSYSLQLVLPGATEDEQKSELTRVAHSLIPIQEGDESPPDSRFGFGRIPLGTGAACPVGPFSLAHTSSDSIRAFGEALLAAATNDPPSAEDAEVVWSLMDAATQATFANYEEFEDGFMAIERGYAGGEVAGTGAVPPYHIDPQVEERCGREVAEHVFYVELYWPDGHSIAGVRLVARHDGLRLWYVER